MMETRIVFWNVGKSDLRKPLCQIVANKDVDIIVLCEPAGDAQSVLEALKNDVAPDFVHASGGNEARFQCFCRRSELDLGEVHDGMRVSVRRMRLKTGDALLALVHGVDIRNYDEGNRQAAATTIANEIRFARSQQGIDRVAIIGDFNLNPFDRAMNTAVAYNALMTKECASRETRGFMGKDYDIYYNPMWGLLGDTTPGPPGTYYDLSSQGPYGWNMLDQAIVSSQLAAELNGVEILDEAGTLSLKNRRGRPDRKQASDHFPIVVRLAGENHE